MELSNAVPEEIKAILQTFICPITLHLVKNPVVASDGRVYEESAFADLITKDKKSPITREPLNGKYYTSFEIKTMIDTLERIYPEIKALRYEEDFKYMNNIHKIKRFIDRKTPKEILNYTDFNLKDMIQRGFIDRIFEYSAFDVLDHIIEYSDDLDKDILVTIICKSMSYKGSNKFVIDYLNKYALLFEDIIMGIFFNNACYRSNKDLILHIMNKCNIGALTLILNGLDWSSNLYVNGERSTIKESDMVIIRKEYYSKLLKLANSNYEQIIHEYTADDTWETLMNKKKKTRRRRGRIENSFEEDWSSESY